MSTAIVSLEAATKTTAAEGCGRVVTARELKLYRTPLDRETLALGVVFTSFRRGKPKRVQPPDLLTVARRFVNQGWTQHADARAADDTPVRPWNPNATSWSLLGALVAALEQLAADQGEPAAISDLARACIMLAEILDADSLEQWNDTPGRTAGDILDALDRAGAVMVDGHDDA